MNRWRVSIQQDPNPARRLSDGSMPWAWSVWHGEGEHGREACGGVGYGNTYDEAAKLTCRALRAGVKALGSTPHPI